MSFLLPTVFSLLQLTCDFLFQVFPILNKLEKLEIKNHKLTAEEKKQWEEEKTCHICKEKFLKDSTDPKISIELKNLLLANKLDCTKIPSLKKVKSQKRIMSLQLHPDKLINDSEQEKHIKEDPC